ncbi:MAG TPA: ABC transporter ATP-binding protein [bacterium]|nr:ABC transporter ATP-binding protein [bacterium]
MRGQASALNPPLVPPFSKGGNRSPVLELKGLSLQREILILDNIDWKVMPGEHWAVLGANGSGKTTLLNVLTAYMTPSRGEMKVLGKRYGAYDWRELRKKIGIVSSSLRALLRADEPALHAVISGREAILNYWGEITESDRRAGHRILKDIECGELEDRPWGYLSQGEQQRVLIGRALMAQPKILILDEPCAGLDMVARETFLDFLQRLIRKNRNLTLLLVTHHVEEIAPFFSHVLLLKAGKVLAAGPKAKVLQSKRLGQAFDADLKLAKQGGRFRSTVSNRKSFTI